MWKNYYLIGDVFCGEVLIYKEWNIVESVVLVLENEFVYNLLYYLMNVIDL